MAALCCHLRVGQIRTQRGRVGETSTDARGREVAASPPAPDRLSPAFALVPQACIAVSVATTCSFSCARTEQVWVHDPAAWPSGARHLHSATHQGGP